MKQYCFETLNLFYIEITKQNPFNLIHARKLFDFYYFVFNQKLSREISPATYLKAVNIGLLLKKYSWVDNFIRQYKNKLTIKFVERSLYNLCKAKYFFELKEYVKSLNVANRITIEYYYYNYASKYLYCQIYYETEDFFKLKNEIGNLNKFLIRLKEKIQVYVQKEIITFIKYSTLLMKIKESNSPDKIFKARMIKKDLKNETNKPPNVYWLYEKFNEIK